MPADGHKLTRDAFVGNQFFDNTQLFSGLPLAGDDPTYSRVFLDFRGANDTSELEAVTGTPVRLDDGATPEPKDGVLNIDIGEIDNDEAYVQSLQDAVNPAEGQKFAIEFRVYYTDVTANKISLLAGFHEEFAEDILGDDGSGLVTGVLDMIAIVKEEDSTDLDLILGNGATVSTVETSGTAALTSDTWHRIGLRVDCAGGNANVSAFLNGKLFAAGSITLTSLADMKFGIGGKTHASEANDLFIDYLDFRTTR